MNENQHDEKKKSKLMNGVQIVGQYLLMFAIALCLSYGFKLAVEPTIVSGISMEPTLHDGDRMLLNTFSSVEKGDIIIFNWEERDTILIKRAIATAGDHLQINEQGVFLNGELLEEGYLNGEPTIAAGNIDVIVPEGKIFAMGDNRMHSLDSRADVGLVDVEDVIGIRMLQFWNGGGE